MYQLYAIHAFLVTYKFILAVELESKDTVVILFIKH